MEFEFDVPDFAVHADLTKVSERVGKLGSKIIQKRIIAGKRTDGAPAPQPKSYKTPPLNRTGKLSRDVKAKVSKGGGSVAIGPRQKRNRKVAAILRSKGMPVMGFTEAEVRLLKAEARAEIARQVASGEFRIRGTR